MSEKMKGFTPPEEDGKEEQNKEFRGLLEDLITQSENGLLAPVRISEDEELSVLDAVENNELSLYAGGNERNDKKLDALNLITSIYDELGKENPDNDFIVETVEELKEYLEINKGN
jgi:hypothetical protein